MDTQERHQRATEVLQAALQAMAQEWGMTVEAVVQVEAVRPDYTTSRAVLVLKPLPDWQPPERPKND